MSEFGTISSGAGSFDNFKSNKLVSGTKEFLESTGWGECSVKAPPTLAVTNSLDEVLVFARNQQASDVHISVNNPILFRNKNCVFYV